ncbi:MAG TPA: hypothetical protein VEU97_14510 [Ktedonobacteraceae bacterium]|jgi:hypothetical protein|nr:hypothetical protein [Ktedonobacteraceae bacterium]
MALNKQPENSYQHEAEIIHPENQLEYVRGRELYDWERKLSWRASGHGWFAKTDEFIIAVSEKAYDEHLTTYLELLGMKRKTWSEIMQPAEEEWKCYCEAIDRFHANLDYWLNHHDSRVQIHLRVKGTRT